MKTSRIFISSLLNEGIAVVLIVAVWGVVSMFYPSYMIPSPLSVITGFSSYLPADFPHHLWVTFYRVMVGFLLAFLLGTLGGVIVSARKWEKPVNSLMVALQAIPGTILGVVFLLMFGIGSATPIVLVAMLTLPIITINTINGLSKKEPALEQYLKTIRADRWNLFYYSTFPALVPVLQSNLSLGMSMAVKVVVLGEFIGSQDGLGYLLNNARIFFDMKSVFFYLILLLVFTLLFQGVQSLFFSVFLRKYYYPE